MRTVGEAPAAMPMARKITPETKLRTLAMRGKRERMTSNT
jgi:hypothetical protein